MTDHSSKTLPKETASPDYVQSARNIVGDFVDEKACMQDVQKAMLNILEDAAAEKRRLQQTQSAVLNILEDLEFEKESAQEANRLKSKFLANMSHELRTPLNAIVGFAKLMVHGMAGPLFPKQREFLTDILSSSDHLLQLINDILDLAKVEAGRMEFFPEELDLSVVAGSVRNTLQPAAVNKNIQIHIEIHPQCILLYLDPVKLKQVLYNYLSNALKFTPKYGSIWIKVDPYGVGKIRIAVEDTGVGIRKGDIKSLFSSFYQLDSSVSKQFQGTGLGLALTKRLVEAQGGSVGVTSEWGKGSCFSVVLPTKTGRITIDSIGLGAHHEKDTHC